MPNDLGIFMTELGADCVATAGDVLGDDSLRTAVILSLFCHRRAEDEDVIPDGTNNKRGWWADTVAPLTDYGLGQTAADGGTTDRIGSRLWLLSREKQLPEVLARAKYYAEESLQWLLDDGRATDVTVTATNPQQGWLALEITITLPDGSTYAGNYNYQPATGFFLQN